MTPIPTVSLVGAGPGHPGLLTLRAVECLREADLILYDKLVPETLLVHANPNAEKVCVTQLAQTHVERCVPIHETMIEAAKQGRRVVRLKGGDPCIFGRAGEEAEALHAAGIPFEIVPGITAALTAAAFAGLPLTHRAHASAVAFVTGHENPDKPDSALDWTSLAHFSGTLVFYMGMSRLEKIAQLLIREGKDPRTPAAAVQCAGTGEQRTVTAPLAELPATVRDAGLSAPALGVGGDVVTLRPTMNWFESLPLFGKRVLVTRPEPQAQDLAYPLTKLGAVVHMLPAVAIRPIADPGPLDRALEKLHTFNWLVFTSVNGVDAFMRRLLECGRDLRALGTVKLAAIGPKTSDALAHFHLKADLVPMHFQSEYLAQELSAILKPDDRVLLARADRGRELLRDVLTPLCHVEQIAVYSQVDTIDANNPVMTRMRRGEINFLTLTSANIARAFLGGLDATCQTRMHSGEISIVTISPITSQAVRELSYPVAGEAKEATTASMIDVLVELAKTKVRGG